ncbi:hypothetical protein T12_6447 [Trichinella patagoniensis]|uniref:Uncharacterized protein n=1 Tax=Trichinella patagoniensis TaxID=990121 RepID=A0A0V1A643_9BILA|nr:hypothetical protein T12_6447 [Trichinella patagoniensis]
MGSVVNVENLSVINNTCRGLPLLEVCIKCVLLSSAIFIDLLSDYPRLSVIPLIGLSNALDTPGVAITTQKYSPLTSEMSDLLFRSLYSGPPSRSSGNNQVEISSLQRTFPFRFDPL